MKGTRNHRWIAPGADGDYWNPRMRMRLLQVRVIGKLDGNWESAVTALTERWEARLRAA
jgi:hypothetical protein